jgi:hypothetical protein
MLLNNMTLKESIIIFRQAKNALEIKQRLLNELKVKNILLSEYNEHGVIVGKPDDLQDNEIFVGKYFGFKLILRQ